MHSTFKDFFLMAELSYDSYIELDIGFSGVQKKVTAWVVKCRTVHAVVY